MHATNPKVLLITPPLLQLNTIYPATPYLAGFLKRKGYTVHQIDLSIELIHQVFSEKGLQCIFEEAGKQIPAKLSDNAGRILALKERYLETISPVIDFLCDNDSGLFYRLADNDYLPRAGRFNFGDDFDWAFGNMGIRDRARFYASLYLDDLADFINETISPHFEFGKYAESLGLSANSFDSLESALRMPDNLLDHWLAGLTMDAIEKTNPHVIGITVPFPGNIYAALKIGQIIKTKFEDVKVVIGGGYVNTELRSITDARIFKYTDFICFDDGQIPLLRIAEFLNGEIKKEDLVRTVYLEQDRIIFSIKEENISHAEAGTPYFTGLTTNKYLSLLEMANPMYRLWNDGKWNKMVLAHGCYWHKCSFCDTSLDYIKRFSMAPAGQIVDSMEEIMKQTGQSSFHFADEAAPPALLKEIAIEILRRKLKVSWWGNIRFEKFFTSDICRLLKASGCIAVSGGIETAHDRLLRLINKGVSVEDAALVCDNFTRTGIMVHAYLMYGFPTQTAQETIDSLEIIRQFFSNHLIQSGFWHLFVATVHSDIGMNPEKYGVEPEPVNHSFAINDIRHIDNKGCDHKKFGQGLKKAVYNYMHGVGLDFPLTEWFDFKIPRTGVPPNFIKNIVQRQKSKGENKIENTVLWLGNKVTPQKDRNGNVNGVIIHSNDHDQPIVCDEMTGKWILWLTESAKPENKILPKLKDVINKCESEFNINFFQFSQGKIWKEIKKEGLVVV